MSDRESGDPAEHDTRIMRVTVVQPVRERAVDLESEIRSLRQRHRSLEVHVIHSERRLRELELSYSNVTNILHESLAWNTDLARLALSKITPPREVTPLTVHAVMRDPAASWIRAMMIVATVLVCGAGYLVGRLAPVGSEGAPKVSVHEAAQRRMVPPPKN